MSAVAKALEGPSAGVLDLCMADATHTALSLGAIPDGLPGARRAPLHAIAGEGCAPTTPTLIAQLASLLPSGAAHWRGCRRWPCSTTRRVHGRW